MEADKEIQQRILDIQKKYKAIQTIERIVPYTLATIHKVSIAFKD
jgi:hypothetical protein